MSALDEGIVASVIDMLDDLAKEAEAAAKLPVDAASKIGINERVERVGEQLVAISRAINTLKGGEIAECLIQQARLMEHQQKVVEELDQRAGRWLRTALRSTGSNRRVAFAQMLAVATSTNHVLEDHRRAAMREEERLIAALDATSTIKDLDPDGPKRSFTLSTSTWSDEQIAALREAHTAIAKSLTETKETA